jgi:hypothetical protein
MKMDENGPVHGTLSSITPPESFSQRLSPGGTLVSQSGVLKGDNSLTDVPAHDTVKLVDREDFAWDNAPYVYQISTRDSDVSVETVSGVRSDEAKKQTRVEQEKSEREKMMEPKLSWFMTMFLLAAVTVVSQSTFCS